MKMRTGLFVLGVVGYLLTGCSGSTSGGVGSSESGVYRGTINYSGYNTCNGSIPGGGYVEIVIRSDGSLIFSLDGYVTFYNAVSGSKISGSFVSNVSGYKYRIEGRINDSGSTVSGTGYVEGNYGKCFEKFQGAFAATRVG
jgi:hypothetical protein